MRSVRHMGDLKGERNEKFERGEWIVERIAWAVMFLVLLAALFGLFGNSPLSRVTEASPDGQMGIQLERFGRQQAPAVLRVRLGPELTRDREVHFWLNQGYMKRVQVQQITPRPERVEIEAECITCVIHMRHPGQPVEVTFHLTPQEMGLLKGQAGVEGGPSVSYWQFIYP